MNTLSRNELTTMAVQIVRDAGTDAALRVYAPRDVPTSNRQHPCILAYTPHEVKNGIMTGGVPEFNTLVMLVLTCRTQGPTAELAQDAADRLSVQVERALLRSAEFVAAVQKFVSVETQVTVNGENEMHLGEAHITFTLEIFQDYDPTDELEDSLEGVNLHLDAISPADLTGTYDNPPFPASVPPAPRTHGPDGRDEGGLQIDFP